MKKILIIILIIAVGLVVLLSQRPFKKELVKGSRHGSLEIIKVRTNTTVNEIEADILTENQTKNEFYISIRSWDIPNNKDVEGKNTNTINIPYSELPFYNDQFLILNVSTLEDYNVGFTGDDMSLEIVKAKILSRDTYTETNSSNETIEFYRLKIQIPDDVSLNTRQAIQENFFTINQVVDDIKLIVPSSFILTEGSKNYVCLVTHKSEAFSVDYQYYNVKGTRQDVKLSDSVINEDPFYTSKNWAIVESGLSLNQEIAQLNQVCE